ncbi:hypothetical protein SAMN05661012_06689 [Chitinophaga sancti]|uniref:Uncharacterized protein n=1 Tax=Chitinophaga sancti TaxID=1004 RepID=A0A1K1T2X6_9BACT|nr:hypothetical protein SAMN05661012_06689 [Chitinophaga sancti]
MLCLPMIICIIGEYLRLFMKNNIRIVKYLFIIGYNLIFGNYFLIVF